MDINKVLEELRREREHLDQVIMSVERLALGGAKRRGRPPKWMAEAKRSAQSGPRIKERFMRIPLLTVIKVGWRRAWLESFHRN